MEKRNKKIADNLGFESLMARVDPKHTPFLRNSSANRLGHLASALKDALTSNQKKELLLAFLAPTQEGSPFLSLATNIEEEVLILALIAIGQAPLLLQALSPQQARTILLELQRIDSFYAPLGGIVGYHATVLNLLKQESKESAPFTYEKPPLCQAGADAVLEGLRALKNTCEIYPIGGVAERLAFTDDVGKPAPAALLPFLGSSLLEGLIRDVEAREYLYFKLFKEQVVTPIVIMTSMSTENHGKIEALLESKKWFGRPKEAFKIVSQPKVPVLTCEGKWSMKKRGELNLKPGGHGALWQVALTQHLFTWLADKGVSHCLIRQINNPLAGQDQALLALLGTGQQKKATLGFASCERLPKAAEGVLVLCKEANGHVSIRNIEYTTFAAASSLKNIDDFPTNTNLLYANLQKLKPLLETKPFPGLMLNMKNVVPFIDVTGKRGELLGGRLESMMQNISDEITSPDKQQLQTFVTYTKRNKLMSTAKRKWVAEKPLLETPQGAFKDLLNAHRELLNKWCQVKVPPQESEHAYLKQGPNVLFLYHPALGPLYSIIAQKIQGGSLAPQSELDVQIAELALLSLSLKGSLLIDAKQITGHKDTQERLHYSHKVGRCYLEGVTIENAGINRAAQNSYWEGKIERKEQVSIVLQGNSEFIAKNVTLKGTHHFNVPPEERWILTAEGLTKEPLKKSAPLYTYVLSSCAEVVLSLNQNISR